ncbi:Hypothetical protein PHPALM_3177 [Phytophthora palmivora]|uniref:DDE Tnp4 domain-containing protein n=1 Tax=Phytophthora palmivora TaxID=4796 RepID=A0A2P4YN19_9STRA|nr:Hypothetical protein PHPALM_3177 [Phytophthora palmivora]
MCLLSPSLEGVAFKSENRSGTKSIEVVNMVQMIVSWLAERSYHIRNVACENNAAFYSGGNACYMYSSSLSHRAPIYNRNAIQTAAEIFAPISSNNIITGCIGCAIYSCPEVEQAPDMSPGIFLRMELMCRGSVTLLSTDSTPPGKIYYSIAFSKLELNEDITNLPFGYYLIGDTAYILAPPTLTPFTRPELKAAKHSVYNFYISQLRNTIEWL